jgi:glycosyltransferase involved in cell wall biosynthesis
MIVPEAHSAGARLAGAVPTASSSHGALTPTTIRQAMGSTTGTPTVSVVIPTIGRWPLLERAVRGIHLQRGVRVQVIVSLDGVEPDAGAAGFLTRDDVTFRASPTRRGQAATRNAGIEAAEGDWVAFLDDDDLWGPEKLAGQVAAASAAGADYAYGSAMIVDDELRPLALDVAPPEDDLARDMLEHNPIPACASNLLVRRDLAAELRFDTELSHFSDWDFAVRTIAAGSGAARRDVQVAYVHHAASMHLGMLDGAERELASLRAKHRALGREIRELETVRWMGAGYRRSGRRGRAAGVYLRAAVRSRSAPELARAGAALLGLEPRRRPSPPAAPDWLGLYR